MSLVNHKSKEIHCKIVYYGPGLGGKTTNLQYIYDTTTDDSKTKLVRMDSDNERTLFFDFLPLELGQIRGYQTRFHLYTVPGQVFYEASRRLILRGADGIVFVADSQIEKMDANQESLESLKQSLTLQGQSLDSLPVVYQWNKRDLPNVAEVQHMESILNPSERPSFEAVAVEGVGVFDTLKALSKQVLNSLQQSL